MPQHKYTIELTDVEQKAMEYVATDVDFWIQNAVHERARLAIEEMVQTDINENLAAGKAVSGTKEEIVTKSKLKNAQARHEENMQKMLDHPMHPPHP
ncbi:MAG TPA: hypothetical protein VIZ32_22990 [Vicinamibacterales bacterium]